MPGDTSNSHTQKVSAPDFEAERKAIRSELTGHEKEKLPLMDMNVSQGKTEEDLLASKFTKDDIEEQEKAKKGSEAVSQTLPSQKETQPTPPSTSESQTAPLEDTKNKEEINTIIEEIRASKKRQEEIQAQINEIKERKELARQAELKKQIAQDTHEKKEGIKSSQEGQTQRPEDEKQTKEIPSLKQSEILEKKHDLLAEKITNSSVLNPINIWRNFKEKRLFKKYNEAKKEEKQMEEREERQQTDGEESERFEREYKERQKEREREQSKEEKEEQERIQKIKEEIEKDKNTRPFLYYVAEKSLNPTLTRILKNSDTGDTSLLWSKEWEDKFNAFAGSSNNLIPTEENEGFFEFNILGFNKIIKNIEQLKSEENGKKVILSYSPDALYKIVGPDGKIIADDIQGYDKATRIYEEATEDYKKKIEEEFNNLNLNK